MYLGGNRLWVPLIPYVPYMTQTLAAPINGKMRLISYGALGDWTKQSELKVNKRSRLACEQALNLGKSRAVQQKLACNGGKGKRSKHEICFIHQDLITCLPIYFLYFSFYKETKKWSNWILYFVVKLLTTLKERHFVEYLVYFFILLWFRIVDKNSVHQKVNRNIDLVTS